MKIIKKIDTVGLPIVGESGRIVYSLDDRFVLKEDRCGIANLKEAFLWADTRFFVLNPTIAISEDGTQIVARKCRVYRRSVKIERAFRKRVGHINNFEYEIDDLHDGNWGFRNGKSFIIDYEIWWPAYEDCKKNFPMKFNNFCKKFDLDRYRERSVELFIERVSNPNGFI